MLDSLVLDAMPGITAKTLILIGGQDQLIPNQQLHSDLSLQKIEIVGLQRIPDSQLEVLPECGPFFQFECPTQVNTLLLPFLG